MIDFSWIRFPTSLDMALEGALMLGFIEWMRRRDARRAAGPDAPDESAVLSFPGADESNPYRSPAEVGSRRRAA